MKFLFYKFILTLGVHISLKITLVFILKLRTFFKASKFDGFNRVHVKWHDKWRETMKIDFKTSCIVVQYELRKDDINMKKGGDC